MATGLGEGFSSRWMVDLERAGPRHVIFSKTFYISSTSVSKPCNELEINGRPGVGRVLLCYFCPWHFT